MLHRVANIRFVVIESPYDSWDHPLMEKMFSRMVGMKLRGYGKEYPYGVMAVDTTDFFSEHLLVCEETPDGLIPILGNKSVALGKCDFHHVPWPGLTCLEEAKATDHVRAMNAIMERTRARNIDLRYAGSWTMEAKERGNKEWSAVLRDLFTAIYVSYYESVPPVEVITGGTCRFKVDNYVKWLGHEALSFNGRELDPINVFHLAGERVLWTHLREFSPEARQVAKLYAHLWKNHVHIKGTEKKSEPSPFIKAA